MVKNKTPREKVKYGEMLLDQHFTLVTKQGPQWLEQSEDVCLMCTTFY